MKKLSAEKQIRIVVRALILGMAFFSGCGSAKKDPPIGVNQCQSPTGVSQCNPIPLPGSSQQPVNGAQHPVAYLLGEYGGNLVRTSGAEQTQPYSLTLSTQDHTIQTSQGTQIATYAYMTLQSNGAAGDFSVNTVLGLQKNGERATWIHPDATLYKFVSPAVSVPALSGRRVSFDIELVLIGTQYFPAQSKISIKDCGFSQDFCNLTLQNVRFAEVLRKR